MEMSFDNLLCGNKLKKVDNVKFLGVIIDDQVTWEPQIEHLKEKLLACIIIIKRISSGNLFQNLST